MRPAGECGAWRFATSPAISSAFGETRSTAIHYLDTHAAGYGFQIELICRAIEAGMRVVEIPTVFRDRRVGRSKMNAAIAIEAQWKVPALRLRMQRLRRDRRPLAGITPRHSEAL